MRSGVRHEGHASDIDASDSELEVQVPDHINFPETQPGVAAEKTYNTFAEADAAAEAEANSREDAYG